MTERLSALLHEEADRLDVPVPPVRESLAAGRRIRRRRRIVAVAAAVSLVAGIGLGAAAFTRGDAGPDLVTDDTSLGEPVDLGAVFGFGSTVYLDGGADQVQLPETAQAFYYTSAGLLVRTNESGMSDGGAPFHFALIGADRSLTTIDLTLGEVVPSTDPRQPYLAYAEASDGRVEVVVRDLRTDEEVARVPVDGLGDWGGWEAPPVALDGDVVYVGDFQRSWAVDWRTGVVTPAEHLDPGVPVVVGGRTVTTVGGELRVVDVATGDDLLAADGGEAPYAVLSPDGRRLLVVDQLEGGYSVYDIDARLSVQTDGSAPAQNLGWTSTGELFSVDTNGVHACASDPTTCEDRPLPPGVDPKGFIHLAGRTYES